MAFEIVTIPCLADNYAFVLRSDADDLTLLVDAPEAGPIVETLNARGWGLDQILITHHHADHIDGVAKLVQKYGSKVVGATADKARLPALDTEVTEGDTLQFAGETVQIFDVSGHTIDHIAFYFPETGAVFTADSLMALGCGRLFEGTPAQMHESLNKLAALPADTIVCSGHEYTASNAAFAVTVDPDNADLQARVADIKAAREKGEPTVPSLLSLELATNPFLRAHTDGVKAAVGMAGADDVAVFAEVRKRKDNF